MANVSRINVTLTAEMNSLVQEAVASGEYATGSEVIGEALHEWKMRRVLRQHARAELQLLPIRLTQVVRYQSACV